LSEWPPFGAATSFFQCAPNPRSRRAQGGMCNFRQQLFCALAGFANRSILTWRPFMRRENRDKTKMPWQPNAVQGFQVIGAEEGTRTPTPLRVHGPEPCASANSATSARVTADSRMRDSASVQRGAGRQQSLVSQRGLGMSNCAGIGATRRKPVSCL
jgi:hypothetical protein